MLTRVRARLTAIYFLLDGRPYIPLALASCVYAYLSIGMAGRPLWHDELYTYYEAKSSSLARVISAAMRLDLQPPLLAILTRASLRVFGDNNIAARLPSIAAFWVASYALFRFVRTRLGRLYGLTAMLAFWSTPFVVYAAEARPYALMIGFFGIAVIGWQEATEGRRRRLGIIATAAGLVGMLMSHIFGTLLLAVLGLAELVRTLERRRPDWAVWAAIIVPAPSVLVYLPAVRRFSGWTVLPPEFQASWFKILDFYWTALGSSSLVPFLALAAALLLVRRHQGEPADRPGPRKAELALVFGLLCLPIVTNLMIMRSSGAFWARYCIASAMAAGLVFAYFLAKVTGGDRFAAGIASAVLLAGLVFGNLVYPRLGPGYRPMAKIVTLEKLDASVPFVTASGLTFLEMNKRESPSFLSRLYYLEDSDAAVRYAHATIFEGTEILYKYFPVRGTITHYRDFIRRSPHFLVLCTPDYPEDWLIPKLMDDGARLVFIGELHRGYRDEMLFDVTINENAPIAP